MRRILPLLLILGMAMPACSVTTPVEPQVQPPAASSEPTATPSLFQSPVISDTPTPASFAELDLSPTITPTISLTATPTLTPTLTTGSILTTTEVSPQPPLLLTVSPQKSPFQKKDPGPEPCG